jgi:hypothetical protein
MRAKDHVGSGGRCWVPLLMHLKDLGLEVLLMLSNLQLRCALVVEVWDCS